MTNDDLLELLGCFVDVVEDFLEDKNVDIPNEDKDEEESAAIIYGADYFALESGFKQVLTQWGLLPELED